MDFSHRDVPSERKGGIHHARFGGMEGRWRFAKKFHHTYVEIPEEAGERT
jgi:hypothetical protein